MALEAVVFPNDFIGCTMKEMQCSMEAGAWGYGNFDALNVEEEKNVGELQQCEMNENWSNSFSYMLQVNTPQEVGAKGGEVNCSGKGKGAGRRKRSRAKCGKNKEEIESQRMTHITIERNRRKQMNEYLAVLRSLMPASYVPRSDQASIVGGAINFVKELEQLAQSLEAEKMMKQKTNSAPFAEFFTFPQYSNTTLQCNENYADVVTTGENGNKASVANIEVTMVESHANLKVLTRRQPKQLLKMLVGLHNLWLTVLHLNVTTIDEMVLYSFSLKVEDVCQLTSVDEIASAVNQIVKSIQED